MKINMTREVFRIVMVCLITAATFAGLASPATVATAVPRYYPGAASDFNATSGDPNAAVPMVSAGWYHTVGLYGNGTVVAVGYNNSGSGQCNVGDWASIVQISAGWLHTVGLKSDGTVVAVGDNSKYGLNRGNTTWQETLSGPSDVGNWTDIVQVSAGGVATLGLKGNGTVVSAGGKAPEWNEPSNNPLDDSIYSWNVGNWTDIVQVAAGGYHNVGLKADGTVVAVGFHGYGECNVEGWTGIVQVAAGLAHTVGLKSDGTVVAVGDNYSGECNVGNWTDIVQVAAGHNYTLGLKRDGTVVAVGNNGFGQCNVETWSDILQVAAGYDHTVGLKSDGTVVAVGDNQCGQCNVSGWNLGTPIPTRVTTNSATDIATNSATINGNLTSLGTATSVDVSFEWATDAYYAGNGSYSNETSPQPRFAIGPFSAGLSSLTPGATYHFKAKAVGNGTAYGGDMTFTTTNNISIKGVTGEVSCAILPGASVNIYNGAQVVGSTTSDSNGNYTLTAPESGTYQIVVSKSGYRGNSTQSISITGTGEYTLDFIGQTGLVPNTPNMSYALACVNHWLYPEPPCGLTMSKVLEVINAWLFPQ